MTLEEAEKKVRAVPQHIRAVCLFRIDTKGRWFVRRKFS